MTPTGWIEAVQAGSRGRHHDVDIIGAQTRRAACGRTRFRSGDLARRSRRPGARSPSTSATHRMAQSVAYCVYGSALYFSGDIDEAQGAFRAAVSLAEKVGNPSGPSLRVGLSGDDLGLPGSAGRGGGSDPLRDRGRQGFG